MGISTIQSYNGAQIFEAVGPRPDADRALLRRHRVADRRHRRRHPRARDAGPPRARLRPASSDDLLPVGGVYAWRREGEHHMWNPETIALLQHSVRHGGQPTYDEYSKLVNEDAARRATLRGLLKFRELPEDEWLDIDDVEPASEIVKRFVTGAMSLGSISRETHETLAIAMNRLGGKSNTGEGGEDPVRFTAGPQRRPAPLGDQAGRLRPLRRQHQLPRQRRRAADQDGPGRQARRGRPAAGPQGRPLHRLDPLHHARRGPDLAAAAPRHLLDRGPQAADLRPALRQPGRADVGQAGVRGRRRHGRGGRGQGQRRPRADRRPRRRHRRLAAELDPGGRHPVGDRPGRDAADAGAQRPALADLGPDRRPAQDGPRRRRRRAAGRRRVRLQHRPADRDGLHHDARLPPQHVPGGHRDAGPGAAQALPGPARARRELLLLRRRGGAAADAPPGHLEVRGSRRPRRPARGRQRDRALEGPRRGPHARAGRAARSPTTPRAGACARRTRRSRARWTGR